MNEDKKVTVMVSGSPGTGKTAIATLIQALLRAQNIHSSLLLTNHEMAPCPTALRQRVHSLIDSGLSVEVIEINKTP